MAAQRPAQAELPAPSAPRPEEPALPATDANVRITRDNLGRFVKGVSGNVDGRPAGARNRAKLVAQFIEEALLNEFADDALAILAQAVKLAKEGDPQMIRMLLTDMVGKVARTEIADDAATKHRAPVQVQINLTHFTGEQAKPPTTIEGQFTQVES